MLLYLQEMYINSVVVVETWFLGKSKIKICKELKRLTRCQRKHSGQETILFYHRYMRIKSACIKASSNFFYLACNNKYTKTWIDLHRIIQWMVKEDHRRGSTNHVHWKAFSAFSNKFKWFFSKISLRVRQLKRIQKRNASHNTVFQKMEELRRLIRWLTVWVE